MLTLPDIALRFSGNGANQYSGGPVTQLEHALQTAHLAEQSENGQIAGLRTACNGEAQASR